MKTAIKTENCYIKNVALVASYQSIHLTQNLGLTTFYQYMNEIQETLQRQRDRRCHKYEKSHLKRLAIGK